jgi:hypothetical protein
MKRRRGETYLKSLVELAREQGYLSFVQLNNFLPQDVKSPIELRPSLRVSRN